MHPFPQPRSAAILGVYVQVFPRQIESILPSVWSWSAPVSHLNMMETSTGVFIRFPNDFNELFIYCEAVVLCRASLKWLSFSPYTKESAQFDHESHESFLVSCKCKEPFRASVRGLRVLICIYYYCTDTDVVENLQHFPLRYNVSMIVSFCQVILDLCT